MEKTVMIINHSASMCQFVTSVLNGAGFDTITAPNIEAAISKRRGREVHFIVSDMPVPEMSDVEQITIRSLFARRICHG